MFQSLPQFPLPTHKVMKKGVVINEFKVQITLIIIFLI